jgi:hypothetical protein
MRILSLIHLVVSYSEQHPITLIWTGATARSSPPLADSRLDFEHALSPPLRPPKSFWHVRVISCAIGPPACVHKCSTYDVSYHLPTDVARTLAAPISASVALSQTTKVNAASETSAAARGELGSSSRLATAFLLIPFF